MAKSYEVLSMLIPDGGYVQVGEEFEGIQFVSCEPITEQEYLNGFAIYDNWKTAQDLISETAKLTVLSKLGITEDELRAALA